MGNSLTRARADSGQKTKTFEQVFNGEYENLTELGTGGFGCVYSGNRKDDPDKTKIAIKVIDVPMAMRAEGLCLGTGVTFVDENKAGIEQLRRKMERETIFEVSNWQNLNHRNLTKFLGCPYIGFSSIKIITITI